MTKKTVRSKWFYLILEVGSSIILSINPICRTHTLRTNGAARDNCYHCPLTTDYSCCYVDWFSGAPPLCCVDPAEAEDGLSYEMREHTPTTPRDIQIDGRMGWERIWRGAEDGELEEKEKKA